MTKSLIAYNQIILALILLFSGSMHLCAHTNPVAQRTYKEPVPLYSAEIVKDRLQNMSSIIDLNFTPEVGKRIKEYTVEYRPSGQRILARVGLYFPMFEQEINKRNLPEELKYIAVIESKLKPNAQSPSGATGLWQIIKSTGRANGLQIDDHIDERKDVLKSTQAALDYLQDLHEELGDWTLAIAAYNCGPGGVRKAIRKAGGSRDYWTIRYHLPYETQKYVPRIIAAMYLMQYYQHHDLTANAVDHDIKYVKEISDGQPHNFAKLAEVLEIDANLLYKLNPQYIQGSYPKNDGHLVLRIPASSYDRYLEVFDFENYKKLLEEKKAIELELIKAKRRNLISDHILEKVAAIEQIRYRQVNSIKWDRIIPQIG